MLDNPIRKGVPKIDLIVDIPNKAAHYRSKPFRVSGLAAAMLECLVKAFPNKVLVNKLHQVVGETSVHSVRRRLTKKLEEHGMTLEYIQWDGVRLIELSPDRLHSVEGLSEVVVIPDRRPLFTSPAGMGSKHGLAISIDGIILNSASELIYGRVKGPRIRDCRLLYRSSVEDLAFALVYGSRVSSQWHPRHDVARDLGVDVSAMPYEPAEMLISQIGEDLYSTDVEHEQFRYGRVLDNEQARLQIGQYITSLGKAIRMPFVREICREWLVREANTYLGDHQSLFSPYKKGEQLRFGKVYLDNPFSHEVPGLLGRDALNSLISFLPKGPNGKCKPDRYSPFALRQFALRTILTHFTTMYEYERIAEVENLHRLPFILRGVVKEEWHKYYETEGELRTVLVRSALYEGLRETEDAYGREQLVKRLLWVRKEPEFADMRSRLSELGAMVKEERSRGIETLLAEIRGNQQRPRDTVDRMGISRNTVMPHVMIKKVDAGAYIKRLEEFFPEISARE